MKPFVLCAMMLLVGGTMGCGGDETAGEAGTAPAVEEAVAASETAAPASNAYEHLLTAEDVARVSGLTGVHAVPRDPEKGAGGDLNFAIEGEELVLMAVVQGADYFDASQARYAAAAVSGVGEAAYVGPAEGPPYMLVFRKGDRAVALSTYFNMGADTPMATYLTQEQLQELGRIVASRI